MDRPDGLQQKLAEPTENAPVCPAGVRTIPVCAFGICHTLSVSTFSNLLTKTEALYAHGIERIRPIP